MSTQLTNSPVDKIAEEEKAGIFRPVVDSDKTYIVKGLTLKLAEAFDMLRVRARNVNSKDRAHLLYQHGKINDEQLQNGEIPEEFHPDLDFARYKIEMCKLIFVGFPDDVEDLNLARLNRAEDYFLAI